MRSRGRVKHRVLVAVVVAGGLALTAAGASAFTDSNSFTNSNTTVGYGSEDVTGATVTSIVYGLNANSTTVTSVTFETSGDTSASAATIGFTVGGTALATSDCAAGSYTSGTPGYTTYVCSSLSQELSTIQATDISVS